METQNHTQVQIEEEKVTNPKKKRRVIKTIAIIIAILLLLLLIGAGAGLIYINVFLNKMDRTEITGNENMPEEEVYAEEVTVDATDSVEHIEEAQKDFENAQQIDSLKKNITNILLIGTDRRSGGEHGRSDAMIMVTMNHKTGNIHLTSFMRAMYVCIPKSTGDTWGMLNAAYSWGGPKLLVETVELNFRVEIDHYVLVDFSAFKAAVDALGGVEIDLSAAEARAITSETKLPTSAGVQLLVGKQALCYSRIRYLDNDFLRTNRQRTVVEALMKKAQNASVTEIMDVANQILPMVNTNLTNAEIMSYVIKGLPMLKNTIDDRMIPFENESGKTYTGMMYVNGMEMYKVDFENTIKILHEYMMS